VDTYPRESASQSDQLGGTDLVGNANVISALHEPIESIFAVFLSRPNAAVQTTFIVGKLLYLENTICLARVRALQMGNLLSCRFIASSARVRNRSVGTQTRRRRTYLSQSAQATLSGIYLKHSCRRGLSCHPGKLQYRDVHWSGTHAIGGNVIWRHFSSTGISETASFAATVSGPGNLHLGNQNVAVSIGVIPGARRRDCPGGNYIAPKQRHHRLGNQWHNIELSQQRRQ